MEKFRITIQETKRELVNIMIECNETNQIKLPNPNDYNDLNDYAFNGLNAIGKILNISKMKCESGEIIHRQIVGMMPIYDDDEI